MRGKREFYIGVVPDGDVWDHPHPVFCREKVKFDVVSGKLVNMTAIEFPRGKYRASTCVLATSAASNKVVFNIPLMNRIDVFPDMAVQLPKFGISIGAGQDDPMPMSDGFYEGEDDYDSTVRCRYCGGSHFDTKSRCTGCGGPV